MSKGNSKEKLHDRIFDEKEMYLHIAQYAMFHHLNQTMKSLTYAAEKHDGQYRSGKDHVPYIYHPLLMCWHGIGLGLVDDNLLSAILLHDVCEDCDISVEDLPLDSETKEIVSLVTKDGIKTKQEYYDAIMTNPKAMIVKVLDRCNNVSHMMTSFSDRKALRYIDETEEYIYPMFDKLKQEYPEYKNAAFLIEYHLKSVIETIKHILVKEINADWFR